MVAAMHLINIYKLPPSFHSFPNLFFILLTLPFLPFDLPLPVQCSTAVRPLSFLSYNVTQKERLFHMDSQDHYNPNISPDLGDIIFWKNFIFITARNNIFKFYRNSSQFYQFQYAMMLPEFDKCNRPDLTYCLRKVKFLFPYTNGSMLGCYAHNFQSHFFKLTNSRFENINTTDVLANAMRKFCSVDSNVETLVFDQGINSNNYFLASGIPKKGFELERLEFSSPQELDILRNSTLKMEPSSLFGLHPGVKSQIKTNNLRDKSLSLGKSYPVSHFEYNGSIFVTFREPAIEFKGLAEYKNLMFSRIAKVCIQDRGSGGFSISPVKYWTSFAKARLMCSTSEKVFFALNEIQATFFDYNGFLFGLFDTPYSEMTSSAICAYDMKTISEAFAGDHYEAPAFQPQAQRNPDVIKDYRPSECTNRSEDIDIDLVNYLQTYPLMKQVVKPVSEAPAFLVHGSNFRLATLTGEEAYWVTSGSKLSKIYILYVGTNKGEILKLVVNVTSQSNSMNTTWLAQWRVFPEDSKKDDNVEIRKILIDKMTGQLLITTHSQVVAMPKSRCAKTFDTCRKCLQSGDPHCSWDIFTSTCIDFTGESGTNVSFNAYLTSSKAEEWCEVIGGPTNPMSLGKEATISSEIEGSRNNQDGSSDPSETGGNDRNAGKSPFGAASGVKNANKDGKSEGDPSTMHGFTTPAGSLPLDASGDSSALGSEDPPVSMKNSKSSGGKNRMLTITLVTGIPCIILGVLAGMGLLYCYALLKANKHSKVSKSSPNELIYAPITMGKSPSNSSDTAPHPENAYMYQQVYAQFLQVDPQEEKHYSTIGSVPSENHYAANTLIGATIGPPEGGTLNRYPTLNPPGAPVSNADGTFLASSPIGFPPQTHEGSSMMLDNNSYLSRGLHHHQQQQPPNVVNQSNANGSMAGANSLTVLNASSINNLSNSFNPNNHIQNTHNNQYPQHHTVVPGAKVNSRMYQQQLQPPNKNSTLAGMCNLPQSVSMINYSHSQLSHPGNLLRDSSQLLTKIPYGSQYKSETKLFQPRPGVNNTYGEDSVSSKLLLFNNSSKQNTAAPLPPPSQQQQQAPDSSNFPRIRRPTSVKYSNKNGGKSPPNVDPLYGSSNPRFRSDSLVQNPTASTYRSDFELTNNPNLRNGGTNGKNGNQYQPGRTSENPLYGTRDYQSQVAHRLAKNRQSPTHNSPKMHLQPGAPAVSGPGSRSKLMTSAGPSGRSKQQLPAISGSQESGSGGRLSSTVPSEAEYMDLEEIPYEGISPESPVAMGAMDENEQLSIDI